jgi:hypothetical protein
MQMSPQCKHSRMHFTMSVTFTSLRFACTSAACPRRCPSSCTRFIADLRKVTSYDAGGLLPAPVDFEQYQTPPPRQCGYAVQLIGNHCVPTSAQAACSDLVPGI